MVPVSKLSRLLARYPTAALLLALAVADPVLLLEELLARVAVAVFTDTPLPLLPPLAFDALLLEPGFDAPPVAVAAVALPVMAPGPMGPLAV
jgi:hypothetical protein